MLLPVHTWETEVLGRHSLHHSYVNESNRILKAYSLPNASDHHALTLAIRLTCTGDDQCLGLKNTDKKPRNAFS